MVLGISRRIWLIALAALLILFLKALLAASLFAGGVRDGAVAALADGGISGVTYNGIEGIGTGGLDVALEGPAAAEPAAVAAVAARDDVRSVSYTATGEPAAPVEEEPEPVEEVAEPEPAPAPAPALDPSVVTLAAAGGAVVLTGEVADEATRSELVAAAEADFGPENVTDQLTIGEVDPEGGQVIVEGEASSDAEQAGWVGTATAAATASGFELEDRTTVRAVADQLNELFALEPIEFDVSRATIRPESIATLDAAAEFINASPDANLRVVGHTDSDGADAANQSLSEARANAVVDYLVTERDVDASRLEAEGRGEAEPLVDPEVTAEDKQRNRRIAWELIS